MKKIPILIILGVILLFTSCDKVENKEITYGYKSFQINDSTYYLDQENMKSILKNTKNEIVSVFDCDSLIDDILYYNNNIYYCERYTSNLYVMDMNGKNIQKILDCNTTEGFYGGDFHSWCIYDGNLYLHSSMVLYKIDLSTYQWELFNHDIGHYQIYNDYLYFIDHAETSFTIYKQDLKTKEIEIVLGEGVSYPKNENYSNFVIAEDGTFYITQRLPYKRLISYKDGKIDVIEEYENIEDYFDSLDELSLRYSNGCLYYVKNTDNTYKLYSYNCNSKQTEEIVVLDEYKKTEYIDDNAFYYYKDYLKNPENLMHIELH